MHHDRVIAWTTQLQAVHHRLEDSLRAARTATALATPAGDLLAHCHGFCSALTDHHEREATGLFARLAADNPGLTSVIDELGADHVVLAALLADFEALLAEHENDGVLSRRRIDAHLDVLHQRMSAHFADEERRLDRALDRLRTTAEEAVVLAGSGEAGRADGRDRPGSR